MNNTIRRIFISKSFMVVIGVAVLMTIVIVLFLPLAYLTSFAESQKTNVISAKTYYKQFDLFNPQVVVFTQGDDGSASVNFLQIQRLNLLWWRVSESSAKTVVNSDNMEASQNLANLIDDVKAGKISQGDNVDNPSIHQYDLQTVKSVTQNEVLFEMTNSNNTHKLQLVSDPDSTRGTILLLDDKKVAGLNNIASTVFDTSGNSIVYTKYIPPTDEIGENTQYSGTIYRLDMSSLKEYVIYQFTAKTWMNIASNSTKIVYAIRTGEIGVIDLASSKNTLIYTIAVQDYADSANIIFIDEQRAVIKAPGNITLSGNEETYELDLVNKLLLTN
jgi:hypothetical protein